ncbi:protein kinase domain-containing protein [Pyxidicoccus xibeiensis]|uniref:protein kinase domain-containing protein n=1 Tax=Pyxidicoccus xibeiensis TaxID=2906759 RepID=UPI0020A7367C|nr:protein kinase [Pyxidicoccus xibeiensis]MCP3138081.1 protein kinase [Pyxidicoccus xibeiensis]
MPAETDDRRSDEGSSSGEARQPEESDFGDSFLREVAHMPPPFRKPVVGERLGGLDGSRFEIIEELGGGAMGQVFGAWDEELQREVALKFLMTAEGPDETSRVSLLQREARAIAHLNHENIVRIFDVSELAGAPEEPRVPCLVMERLEGESLDALLSRVHRLGLRRSLEIMSAVAAGLAHAHERGIVHRDLKPSNVFITRQGPVKLLDFGLAHLLAAGSAPLPHLPTAGTPSYMSPEQWRGEKQDARTDVWSAGIMLFEMLTGKQPYRSGSLELLRREVLSAEPVPSVRTLMPGLPEELDSLVATALAKDPRRRLPSAWELRERLRLLEERLGPWREEPLALPPQRRQVTLVSCKLAGLGGLAEALDAEDFSELEAAFHLSCSEIIQRHGGSTTTCVGDEVLACFGYPVAQEEDSEHAVRAGMALSHALPDMLRKRLPHLSLGTLAVGVGLHTEMVAFDDILPELRGRTPAIQGEAPRIAAWLARQAGSNEVLLSHTSHTLVKRSFDAEPLGPRTFQGLAGERRMECWRVVRARKAVFRFDRALAIGTLSPLVDREQELGQLLDCWAHAEQGQGGLVLITGEAGIGKSRLIQELRERACPKRSIHLRCQCWSQFANSAFYPIIEMVQHLLHLDPEGLPPQNLRALEARLGTFGVSPERMALIAAFLSLPVKENLPPLQLSPERQKERTFEALADLLLRISRERPVLGVVEDLHWADPSTLALLGYLLEKLGHSRVLLVLSARPGCKPSWWGEPGLHRLVLERLSAELTGTLVKEAAGEHALSEEMVRQLVSKTDGVPLFAEELTYMMLERAGPGGPPSLGTLRSIPVTLHELLLARLDMLPARQKALAQLCSVVGRSFSHVLLATLTQRSPTGLRRDVEALVAAGLLQEVDAAEPCYQFRHALLQEAAYQSQLRGTRRQHHRRIAQALVEQFPDWVEAQPELLAHHYTEAGEFQPAVHYWAQAGIRASLRSANREAVSHLQQALKLLRALPDRDQRMGEELQLLIALGIPLSQEQGYRSHEVKQTYSRARELFHQVGESLPRLELSYWGPFAYYFARAEYAKSHELAEQLVDLGQRQNNRELLSLGYRMMGTDFFTWGRMKQGLEYVERALACSDFTLEEHRALALRHWTNPRAMALSYACVIHSVVGQEERARHFEREALELARSIRHPHTLAFVLTHTGVARMMRRDVPGTLKLAEETHALAREHWFRLWLVWSGLLLGWARSELGHPDEGLAVMRKWLGQWRLAGIRAGMPLNIALLSEVHLRLKQPVEALTAVREGLKWVAASRESYFESELYRLEGEALRALGRTQEAHDSFLQGVRIAYAQGAHGFEQHALRGLDLPQPDLGMREEGPGHV